MDTSPSKPSICQPSKRACRWGSHAGPLLKCEAFDTEGKSMPLPSPQRFECEQDPLFRILYTPCHREWTPAFGPRAETVVKFSMCFCMQGYRHPAQKLFKQVGRTPLSYQIEMYSFDTLRKLDRHQSNSCGTPVSALCNILVVAQFGHQFMADFGMMSKLEARLIVVWGETVPRHVRAHDIKAGFQKTREKFLALKAIPRPSMCDQQRNGVLLWRPRMDKVNVKAPELAHFDRDYELWQFV